MIQPRCITKTSLKRPFEASKLVACRGPNVPSFKGLPSQIMRNAFPQVGSHRGFAVSTGGFTKSNLLLLSTLGVSEVEGPLLDVNQSLGHSSSIVHSEGTKLCPVYQYVMLIMLVVTTTISGTLTFNTIHDVYLSILNSDSVIFP
ncbi:hypothetical protein Tco_0540763 [Tanacetum coccineum]